MTVQELIEELRKYNPNKMVEIYCSYDCGYGGAGGTEIVIEEDNKSVQICNYEC